MGEYATHNGHEIKIGTCESMYYLRADQAANVVARSGSVDPIGDAGAIRFRFPFPDEDGIAPGQFDDYDRRRVLYGMRAPDELADEHYAIQFTSPHGYNVCLRCPESIADQPTGFGPVPVADGVKVHRNGFKGATFLSQQKFVDGQLVPVLQCVCGMAWRVQTLEECDDVFASLADAHTRYVKSFVHEHERPTTSTYTEIADRIRQGFDREYVASLGFRSVVTS